MSLRSILGGSRIKKKSASKPRSTSSPSGSPLSTWQRTKSSGSSAGKAKARPQAPYDDGDEDYFQDDLATDDGRLPNHGLAHALAADLSLRDVPQAMAYARAHMFDALPASHSGMGSARVSAVLRFRAALPPVVTAAHVQALLAAAGPTAVEREAAELVRAGAVRRIVVPRRGGGVGEALVRADALEALVAAAEGDGRLDAGTAQGFRGFLRESPAAVRVPRVVFGNAPAGEEGGGGRGERKRMLLSHKQTDQLVRAGFLTAQHTGHDAGVPTGTFSRPEDRYSLTSLESISQAASGSMAAVGGVGALHASGGSGGGGGGNDSSHVGGFGDLTLSVPGHGTYLKLVSAALAHVASLLEKTGRHREAPETVLRDRWDGGIANDEASLAKRARGEFVGVTPGRTRKWKEFYGLSFDWVLQEAVGTGLVEVFETKSVGRGVRLI